jgi:hypothetical protein
MDNTLKYAESISEMFKSSTLVQLRCSTTFGCGEIVLTEREWLVNLSVTLIGNSQTSVSDWAFCEIRVGQPQ